MIINKVTPLLYVADVAASLELYQRDLGFEIVGRMDRDGAPFYVGLKSPGGAELMLNRIHDDRVTTALPDDFGAVLYFSVESVYELTAALRRAGHTLADPEPQAYGLDQIWLRDPDGYQLCFTSVSELGRRRE